MDLVAVPYNIICCSAIVEALKVYLWSEISVKLRTACLNPHGRAPVHNFILLLKTERSDRICAYFPLGRCSYHV